MLRPAEQVINLTFRSLDPAVLISASIRSHCPSVPQGAWTTAPKFANVRVLTVETIDFESTLDHQSNTDSSSNRHSQISASA